MVASGFLTATFSPLGPTGAMLGALIPWAIIAVLSFFAGLILDTVTRGRREMRRLAYLAQPAPVVAEK